MKLEHRKTIIKELLSDTLSKEQRTKFSELDEVDAQLRKQWSEAANEDMDLEMKNQIWEKIKSRRNNKKRTLFLWNPKWQMVAAAVALLIASAGWWLAAYRTHLPEEFIEVMAQDSQLYTLPDSSKVWMQQGSSLRYAKAFLKDRKVWLKGNSLFEVTRQNGAPFQVYINQAVIEVKGTSFDVHQHAERQENEVILYSGKVDFTAENQVPVEMQPLQKITHHVETGLINKERIKNISYKNGRFQFTDLPLKQLIEMVNSKYNSRIRLEGINPVREAAFTGRIGVDEPLEDVLHKICFSLSLEQKIVGEEIIIYKQ